MRDRSGGICFTSSILMRYLRRTKSVEELLPWLYLKGISTGDFGEALAVWWEEYEAWRRRDLSARRYVYFWADGVYFSPRLDHDKQCVLGFWKALREVYGEAREQRCWVHKTINVLNQMPKSLQARAKGHLQDIWMAETKATRRPPSTSSFRPMARSTTRRSSALSRTGTGCSPSTTSRPNIGSTSAPPTRSKAPAPPSVSGQ